MKNKLAVVSFVLSLLWITDLLLFLGTLFGNSSGIYTLGLLLVIPAIVISIISLIRISKKKLDGKVLSWVALIICMLPFLVALLILLRNMLDCGRWICLTI